MIRHKKKSDELKKKRYEEWKRTIGDVDIKNEWKPLTVKYEIPNRNPELTIAKSNHNLPFLIKTKPKYEGEMLEREKTAQIEIEKKKLRVAPLHKSNYIYLDPGTDPGDLGKKK